MVFGNVWAGKMTSTFEDALQLIAQRTADVHRSLTGWWSPAASHRDIKSETRSTSRNSKSVVQSGNDILDLVCQTAKTSNKYETCRWCLKHLSLEQTSLEDKSRQQRPEETTRSISFPRKAVPASTENPNRCASWFLLCIWTVLRLGGLESFLAFEINSCTWIRCGSSLPTCWGQRVGAV